MEGDLLGTATEREDTVEREEEDGELHGSEAGYEPEGGWEGGVCGVEGGEKHCGGPEREGRERK